MVRNADDLLNLLIEKKIARCQDIEGCSEEEIKELENRLNIGLPSDYKDFLLVFGKKAGIFLSGEYVYKKDFDILVKYSQEYSNYAFSSIKAPRLVCWAYLGDEVLYYNLNEKESSKVHLWSLTQNPKEQERGGKVFSSLWCFLEGEALTLAKSTLQLH